MKSLFKWVVSTILFVCLVLASNAAAEPVSSVTGADVNIDATKSVSICAGTGDVRIATDCTGGGTQSSWVFNNSTGKFTGSIDSSSFVTDTLNSTSSLTITTTSDANRKWVFSDTSDTALFLTVGDNTTGQNIKILTGTTDGTDTAILRIGHGAAGGGANRGPNVVLNGNEASGTPGDLVLSAGTITGGNIELYGTSSNTLGWSLDGSNNWLSDATSGGGLIMPLSGAANKGITLGKAATPADASTATGLYIFGDPSSSPNMFLADGVNNSLAAILTFGKSRATDGTADVIVQNGDNVGQVVFSGANGATFTNAARIIASISGVPGASNDMPGKLELQTTPDGSGTLATVLTLDQDKTSLFTGFVRSSATSDIGWSLVSVANQACNTTCTSACVMGQETTSKAFLACTDATADICLCAGAS